MSFKLFRMVRDNMMTAVIYYPGMTRCLSDISL